MNMHTSGLFGRSRTLLESGILRNGRDRHSHILFGVDDGVSTPEESLQALAYEEGAGISEVWCTPHIMEDLPNGSDMLRRRFEELSSMYTGPVRLRLAAEYMLDSLFLERLQKGDLLVMDEDMLLVETSTAGAPYRFEDMLKDILSAGYRPVLAHPERYHFLSTDDYARLRRTGVLLQMNIGSICGFYGKESRMRAERLLKEDLYSLYGSDCHNAEVMRHQYGEIRLSREILNKVAQLDCIL